MDDFVIWSEREAELRAVWQAGAAFLAAELRLELKPNVALNRTAFGMDILGYRLHPGGLRLARRSKVRFARKFRQYEREPLAGRWTERQLQARMRSLVAFMLPAQGRSWRLHMMQRFGVAAHRLEPGDPRRQLKQYREQLPAGAAEQQPRAPCGPGSSSTSVFDDALADPAAILSARRSAARKSAVMRPGASSGADAPRKLRAFWLRPSRMELLAELRRLAGQQPPT